MKKLLTLVAVAACAVVAHAAALNWTSIAVDKDGEEFSGGQAYLIQITEAATFAVASDLTITGGMIVDSTSIVESQAAGLWTTSTLTGGTTYNFAVLLTTAGTAGTTTPTAGMYGVDYNGDNATTYYNVTWDADTGAAFEPNWDGNYATAMASSVTSVPEPTSGLLLLIGMAGLALRRKHA